MDIPCETAVENKVIRHRSELERAAEEEMRAVVSVVSRALIKDLQNISSRDLAAERVTRINVQKLVQSVFKSLTWVNVEAD